MGISQVFRAVVQMAEVNDTVEDVAMSQTLAQRRGIILTIVGATDPDSQVLKKILGNGFLSHLKHWLDDILQNKIGSVDLLPHLLSNICMLPVTKELVTSSRLGKQVSARKTQ